VNILIYSKYSTYIAARVGGAETSFRHIAEKLVERGHHVTYLTSSNSKQNTQEETCIAGVTVVFYSRFRDLSSSKSRSWLPGKSARKRWMETILLENIQKYSIDLVYTHYDLQALKALLNIRDATAQTAPFKVVMRMGGLKWHNESLNRKSRKRDYEHVFSSVDSINYNTPGLETLCLKSAEESDFRFSPRDSFVGDIGARTTIVTPAIARKAPQETLNVVVATRFSSYQKRQDILVESIRLLDSSVKVDLMLIGTGPEQENIEAKIKQYGLGDIIKIMPFVEQTKLWQMLRSADLLCHPCEFEGLSKIIAESMLLGLPVLASKVMPLTDYINDNHTGYLVKNEPAAWAKKLTEIYRNQESLYDIAKSAQSFAVRHYDVDRNIAVYETQFSRIISQA